MSKPEKGEKLCDLMSRFAPKSALKPKERLNYAEARENDRKSRKK